MPPFSEDIKVIIDAQNGHQESFQQILKNNLIKSKIIIKTQFSLSTHDLEDIIQIVSLKVWMNIKEYRFESAFYNWFFSIFKNETITFLLNKNKIEQNELFNLNVHLENDDQVQNDNKLNIPTLDSILEDTARTFLERKESIAEYKQMIAHVMSKLKNNHQKIISLILIEEKSYKETAEILNLPVGTVMSRLYYAKIEAKKFINEYSRINNVELTVLG